MIVRCTSLSTGGAPNEKDVSLYDATVSSRDYEIGDLDVGREYNVYCVDVCDSIMMFYLLSCQNTPFPVPYPDILFEIIDGRISSDWTVFNEFPPDYGITVRIAPDFWSNGPDFYEHLVDGRPAAVELFGKQKANFERLV